MPESVPVAIRFAASRRSPSETMLYLSEVSALSANQARRDIRLVEIGKQVRDVALQPPLEGRGHWMRSTRLVASAALALLVAGCTTTASFTPLRGQTDAQRQEDYAACKALI